MNMWGFTAELMGAMEAHFSGWLRAKPYALPLSTDCSGFATMCYWLAGAPDPNGLHYAEVGYTGTMLAHGLEVNLPEPGDLIVYGPYPGHHVVIYLDILAMQLGVNLGEAVMAKWNRTSEKVGAPLYIDAEDWHYTKDGK